MNKVDRTEQNMKQLEVLSRETRAARRGMVIKIKRLLEKIRNADRGEARLHLRKILDRHDRSLEHLKERESLLEWVRTSLRRS